MITKTGLFLSLLMLPLTGYGQNLFEEKIRKIGREKKSVFFDKGIFFGTAPKGPSTLNGFRHHFHTDSDYERLVFDFNTPSAPRIYAYIDPINNKLHIDAFQTTLRDNAFFSHSSPFIATIDFFDISEDLTSLEVSFKRGVSVEIFTLATPGRLVVDIKELESI